MAQTPASHDEVRLDIGGVNASSGRTVCTMLCNVDVTVAIALGGGCQFILLAQVSPQA